MKKLIIISSLSLALLASGVKSVDNQQYINECGSCHFAFQPGLLPQKSWIKIMKNLENHFQTDASLEKKDKEYLKEYLIANASDKAMSYKRSRKITKSIRYSNTPIKITEVPYFKKEHRELSTKMINQKEVGTLSNCTACHTTASQGVYKERYINIPNYGKWDD